MLSIQNTLFALLAASFALANPIPEPIIEHRQAACSQFQQYQGYQKYQLYEEYCVISSAGPTPTPVVTSPAPSGTGGAGCSAFQEYMGYQHYQLYQAYCSGPVVPTPPPSTPPASPGPTLIATATRR